MNAWPGTGGTHKVSYERPFFTRSIFPVTMLGVAPIPRRPPGSRRARWEPAHNHTHWRCQPHRWALLLCDPKHRPPCPSGPAIGQAHELVEKFVRHFYYLAFNEVTFLKRRGAPAASWIHRRMAQMGPGRTLFSQKGEISPKVLPVTHLGAGIPQVGRPRLPPAPARLHTHGRLGYQLCHALDAVEIADMRSFS